MSELRCDPFSGDFVIIAPERADRPGAYVKTRHPDELADRSPFVPGREGLTPSEVYAVRAPGTTFNGPGWNVRVIPNRFPALRTETQPVREAEGVFDRVAGTGAHEVIVESPDPRATLATLAVEHVEHVLATWAQRLNNLARDHRLRHAQIFRNQGPAAGATVMHPHSQLVALPLVPREVRDELSRMRAHFEAKERCLTCDVLAQELAARTRIVAEDDQVIALCPFASKSAFEVMLFPRAHRSAFERSDARLLSALARALRTVLRKLDVALEQPAHNLWLTTLPLREPDSPHTHFRLTVRPALSIPGGFEWGSGLAINPALPEEAARFLRQTEAP